MSTKHRDQVREWLIEGQTPENVLEACTVELALTIPDAGALIAQALASLPEYVRLRAGDGFLEAGLLLVYSRSVMVNDYRTANEAIRRLAELRPAHVSGPADVLAAEGLL